MQIASQLGVSFGRVYQILRKRGVPTRPPLRVERPLPAPKPPKIADKIIDYLKEHPRSSVVDIATGIQHENVHTVGALLSRLKKTGSVISESGNSFGYLWATSPTV